MIPASELPEDIVPRGGGDFPDPAVGQVVLLVVEERLVDGRPVAGHHALLRVQTTLGQGGLAGRATESLEKGLVQAVRLTCRLQASLSRPVN